MTEIHDTEIKTLLTQLAKLIWDKKKGLYMDPQFKHQISDIYKHMGFQISIPLPDPNNPDDPNAFISKTMTLDYQFDQELDSLRIFIQKRLLNQLVEVRLEYEGESKSYFFSLFSNLYLLPSAKRVELQNRLGIRVRYYINRKEIVQIFLVIILLMIMMIIFEFVFN